MIDVQTAVPALQGQLQTLNIPNSSGTGDVFFQGAQVTAWAPNGAGPVLWLGSRNRFLAHQPIRGGIPVCLPWFGGTAAPRHGFARLVPWELSSILQHPDHHILTFDLDHQPSAAGPEAWPHPFQARFQVLLSSYLSMTLSVTHLGEQPAVYEPALHPYFQVADVRRVRISGLDGAPFCDYGSLASAEPGLNFGEHGIDRVYACSSAVTIHDDGNSRDIILHAPGAGSRIIWNPGAPGARATPDFADDDWKSFICVELGNVKDNAVTLTRGQRHTFSSTIEVVSR